MSHHPIILGIVDNSAAGKTTLTKGIAKVLGSENVTVICTDDYHSYDRQERAEVGITALHPDCNYLDYRGASPGAAPERTTNPQASP